MYPTADNAETIKRRAISFHSIFLYMILHQLEIYKENKDKDECISNYTVLPVGHVSSVLSAQ